MQKLSLSLAVYRGLLEIPVIRRDVLAKLVSMLLHPFPKVARQMNKPPFLMAETFLDPGRVR